METEVVRSIEKPADFVRGPMPFRRDSPSNLRAGFVLIDHHYISARWPGDAHKFGTALADQLMPLAAKF